MIFLIQKMQLLIRENLQRGSAQKLTHTLGILEDQIHPKNVRAFFGRHNFARYFTPKPRGLDIIHQTAHVH
jgi:hypothetical protein